MDDIILIQEFMKYPTPESASVIPLPLSYIIYGWCSYSTENKIGNYKLARTIKELLIPNIKPTTCMDRRGVKSLLLALRLLKSLCTEKNWQHYVMKVDTTKESITISFDPSKNEGTFNININKEESSISSSFIRTFIIDYFGSGNKTITDIYFSIGKDNDKIFYRHNRGIVWNIENPDDYKLPPPSTELDQLKIQEFEDLVQYKSAIARAKQDEIETIDKEYAQKRENLQIEFKRSKLLQKLSKELEKEKSQKARNAINDKYAKMIEDLYPKSVDKKDDTVIAHNKEKIKEEKQKIDDSKKLIDKVSQNIIDEQKKLKKCSVCDILNPPNTKQCVACETIL